MDLINVNIGFLIAHYVFQNSYIRTCEDICERMVNYCESSQALL